MLEAQEAVSSCKYIGRKLSCNTHTYTKKEKNYLYKRKKKLWAEKYQVAVADIHGWLRKSGTMQFTAITI